MSTVWFAVPTTVPSRRTFSAGFSDGWRVDSSTMLNTWRNGLPKASCSDQPVSASATGFICMICVAASVTMTPSPMLLRMREERSSLRCSRRAANTSAVMSWQITITPAISPEASNRGL